MPLDVGVLKLKRASQVQLKLVNPELEPIEGAFVRGALGAGHSDALGLVRVPYGPRDTLSVLAPGFALQAIPSSSILQSEPEPQVVILTEGYSLEISMAPVVDTPCGQLPKYFSVTFPDGMFDPAVGWEYSKQGSSSSFLMSAHRGVMTHVKHDKAGDRAMFEIREEGVVLSGLGPGMRFDLVLLGHFREELDVQSITLPGAVGRTSVQLQVDPAQNGGLLVAAVDEQGQPVAGATAEFEYSGSIQTAMGGEDGEICLPFLTLGPLELVITSPGHLPTTLQVVVTRGPKADSSGFANCARCRNRICRPRRKSADCGALVSRRQRPGSLLARPWSICCAQNVPFCSTASPRAGRPFWNAGAPLPGGCLRRALLLYGARHGNPASSPGRPAADQRYMGGLGFVLRGWGNGAGCRGYDSGCFP